VVTRAHGNATAFGGERFGGGKSNSLAGRGYQRYTAFKSKVHRGEFGIINGEKLSPQGTQRVTEPHAFILPLLDRSGGRRLR